VLSAGYELPVVGNERLEVGAKAQSGDEMDCIERGKASAWGRRKDSGLLAKCVDGQQVDATEQLAGDREPLG
jgi:hypothetical protein